MKKTIRNLLVLFVSLATAAMGQGTFIYDQQSDVEGPVGKVSVIQGLEPFGQSFTPTLSTVGFIRLHMGDANFGNGLGATVSLNLRSDLIAGPIISSTGPVTMPDGAVDIPILSWQHPWK